MSHNHAIPSPESASRLASEKLGMWIRLKEDKKANRNSLLQPGLQAMIVYRLGRWAFQGPRWRRPFLWLAKVLHVLVRNFYGIELYWTAQIGRRFSIWHQGAIVIHRYCTIGDDCIVRQGVTIGAADEYDRNGAPILGNNVDVGAGAMILGKIRIGDNVRIGPNAVVMTDVPSNSTVFAPPSRIVAWG